MKKNIPFLYFTFKRKTFIDNLYILSFLILLCGNSPLLAAIKPILKHGYGKIIVRHSNRVNFPASEGVQSFGYKTNKSNFVAAPTLSYTSPQTYIVNTAITPLTPTSSGIAPSAYGAGAVTLGLAFNHPHGVAIDVMGNVYVADLNNGAVKMIPAGGGSPITLATGLVGPQTVAVDASGNIYVTDQSKFLKMIPAGGGTLVTVGSAFNAPSSVTIDTKGNIYVTDQGFVKEEIKGTNTWNIIGGALLSNPIDVAVDGTGNVFVAGYGSGGVIQEILIKDGSVVNLKQGFANLNSIAVDGAGNVYVADGGNNVIDELPAGTTTLIPIGSGFNFPTGVEIDGAGNLYVADYSNNAVKKINAVGGYYITPFLPAGLSFDNATGIISGTPTAVSPATNYTITGYNSSGSATATVNLGVVITPPIVVGPVTGTITSCAGTASVSPNIQQFTLSGSGLLADIIATAPAGFEVSLAAGNGYGSSVTLSQSGGAVNSSVVYVRSSAVASGNISGNVTLTSAGSPGLAVPVTGLINALPGINGVANQTVINGGTTTAINFTGTANTFNWVNNTPGIGLAASGTSNIPSFVAVNNGSSPVTATITVTPQSLGLAYVVELFGNLIQVINTASHSVVSQIQVGSLPFGISASSNGSRIYVTNGGDGTVSVINTANNSVTGIVTVGSRPQGLFVSPDGSKVFVANYISSTVSVINTTNNAVVATIPVGANPLGVAISPDGSKAYITNAGDNTVSVINTATNTVAATINVGQSPRGITVSPDGNSVYLANVNSNTVSVISAATNTVVSTIAVASQPLGITISPDGTRVYTANDGSNNVSVISTTTNTVVTTIPVGANPYGISIRPDGNEVYVANLGSNNVSVINTATNAVSATVSLNGSPFSLGNFITGGTGCSGSPITFTITVNSTVPTITTGGVLTALNTIYGTASASGSFTVSGTNMTAGILITPPSGFKVSTDNVTFSNTVTVGAAGTIALTTVYVRLSGSAAAGSYSGNIVLSSTGTSDINIATITSVINKLPVTVTATAISKIYGSSDPALLYSITAGSLAAGDVFTGSLLRDPGEGVGTYAINQGTLALSSNYTLNYSGGNFTISPKSITVTADVQSKIYGNADPLLTYSITTGSLVGSDTFTGALTRDAGENVGPYAIKQGTLGLGLNYNITFAGANLTIGQRAITITADIKTKIYGDTDPALTYTVSAGSVSGGDVLTGTLARDAGENVGNYTIKQGTLALSNNYNLTYNGAVFTIQLRPVTVSAGPQNKIYGDADPALTYALTSGSLVGSDALTGSLTRDAGENVGIYSIKQGTLTLNANYTLTYTGANLTIGQRQLNITADNQNKSYGQPNPALTISYGPFANGDTKASLTSQAIAATVAVTGSPAGTYNITVSGATSSNYSINFIKGTLTVNQVALTVTADNQNKIYGQPNPQLTYNYNGFVNGDTQANLTSPATASTTATAGSPAAAYDIIVNGASSPNYTLNYVKGTLTIGQALLTVTADNQSRVYGQANPPFTFSYIGFVNGDSQTSLSTQPAASTTATTSTAVGTYAIIPGGAASANYTFNYQNGILTISQAVRTLTFNGLGTKTFGGADFNPGASASSGEPIIYSSDNPAVATIINGLIHISGAGSATITATVAANNNYSTTPSTAQVLTVNKANQTVDLVSIPTLIAGATYNLGGVTASSGLPVSFTISNPAVASVSGQTLNALGAGNATLTASQEGNANYNAAVSATITITVSNAGGDELIVHKAVSPNGDRINDILYIENIKNYPVNTVTVINRNGVKVFQIYSYDNVTRLFDGHSNITGAIQQAGTYFYLVEYTVNGERKRKTGYFELKYY